MSKVIVTSPEELEQIIARIIQNSQLAYSGNPPPKEKHLLNLTDTSKLLDIPENTIYGYTSKNMIPHLKIGRALKFDPEDIMTWLEGKKCKTVKQIQNAN